MRVHGCVVATDEPTAMLGRLFFIFSTVTLLELAILVPLAQWMGIGATILLVLATGVLGAWLARREGLRALQRFREQANQGKAPTEPMLDGVAILAAAIFLMTPGVLTDILGVVLLLPIGRVPLKKYLRQKGNAWFKNAGNGFSFFHVQSGGSQKSRTQRYSGRSNSSDRSQSTRQTSADKPFTDMDTSDVTVRDVEFVDATDDSSQS